MNNKQQFHNFVDTYYSWIDNQYAINSIMGDPSSTQNKFIRELEKGQILPADIVSYASLVNQLFPLTQRQNENGDEEKQKQNENVPSRFEERKRGRQQWNASSELNWRIDANDSKIDRFRKNVQKMCTNDFDNISNSDRMTLYALSNVQDFRIQDLRPFGLYLGLVFKDMIDESGEEKEDESGEEKEEKEEKEEEEEEEEESDEEGEAETDFMAGF